MRIIRGCTVLLCLYLAGCGTIVRGTTETYRVESEPAGARAVFSSGETCITPCEIDKKRNEPFTVRVEKEGFLPFAINVHEKDCEGAGTTMLGNLLMVGSVLWATIDSINGANKELTPNPCLVNLVPERVNPES